MLQISREYKINNQKCMYTSDTKISYLGLGVLFVQINSCDLNNLFARIRDKLWKWHFPWKECFNELMLSLTDFLVQTNSFKARVVCDAIQMFEIPTENNNILYLYTVDVLLGYPTSFFFLVSSWGYERPLLAGYRRVHSIILFINPRSLLEKIVTRSLEGGSIGPPLLLSTQFIRLTWNLVHIASFICTFN